MQRNRQRQLATLPEFSEIRRLMPLAPQHRRGLFIQHGQPFSGRAAFGESLPGAKMPREVGEDVLRPLWQSGGCCSGEE